MAGYKRVKLGKIADILNGIPDSSKSVADDDARAITYNLIQPNHLGAFNDIHDVAVVRRQTPLADKYLLRSNDILIKRLNPDNVTLITQAPGATTFSSNLFVVRLRGRDCHPAYLACLLESRGMAGMNSNLVGSMAAIRSISIKTLSVLNVPVIDYQKQKAIGRMWLIYKERQKLLEDLKEEDKRLLTAAINSVTAGED